ncbi:MAG: MFS transporter [Spirochaetaceae bacterium]|jgi:fucose permease|nr:MFS transporter [Spirochaetaceae bacterium]
MHLVLNIPLWAASCVSLAISCGTFASSLLSARLISVFGTGKITVLSVGLVAVSLFLFSFSGNLYFLCLCALPLGMGAGAIDAGLNNYVAINYNALHMNWLHCFWGAGASLGPIIMSRFLSGGNEKWFMGYRAVAAIQICLFFILVVSLPLWRSGNAGAGKHPESEKKSFFGVRDALKTRGVKSLCSCFICYCGLEVTAGIWTSSFLVHEHGLTSQSAARWTTLFYGGVAIGRFFSGFLAVRLKGLKLLRLGFLIIAISIAFISVPFINIHTSPGALFLGFSFFMLGAGCAPVFPTLMHETPRLFGVKKSQGVIGLELSASYLSASISPAIFGVLAQTTSFKLFTVVLGAFLAAKIVLVEKVYALKKNALI